MSDTGDITDVLTQSVHPTWRIFYNSVTYLINDVDNLSNSVDDFENLLLTFLREFDTNSDIFVIRCVSNINSHEVYKEIEKEYFTFTLWFQGCLYYCLSFTALKKIHQLIIESQVKILNRMVSHPHRHKQLIQEFIECLKFLDNFARCPAQSNYEIKQFLTKVATIDDMTLSPYYPTVSASNYTEFLQSTIKILHQILLRHIDLPLLNYFIKDIFSVLISILNTTKENQVRIQIVNSINLILNEITDLNVEDHLDLCVKFLSTLKNLILNIDPLQSILCDALLESINIFCQKGHLNLLTESFAICCLIKNRSISEQLNMKCDSAIINMTKHRDFFMNEDLMELKLAEELQLNTIDMLDHGQVRYHIHLPNFLNDFSKLIEKMDNLPTYEELLLLLKQIGARFITLLKLTDQNSKIQLYRIPSYFKDENFLVIVLRKIQNVLEMLNSHETNSKYKLIEYFGCVIQYILLLTNFSAINKSKLKSLSFSLQHVFTLIAAKFMKLFTQKVDSFASKKWIVQNIVGDLKSASDLSVSDVSIVLLCGIHCAFDNEISTWINVTLKLFSSTNCEVKITFLKYIPFLTAVGVLTIHNIIAEVLIPIITNEINVELLNAACEAFTFLICIAGNQYLMVNHYDASSSLDYFIKYTIICSHCDQIEHIKSNEKTNENLYSCNNRLYTVNQTVFEENCSQKIQDRGHTLETLLKQCLKQVVLKYNKVKIHFIKMLSAISFHFSEMVTLTSIQLWISLVADVDVNVRKAVSCSFIKIIENIERSDAFNSNEKTTIFNECCQGLVKACHQSLQEVNKDIQKTILITVKMFGFTKIKNSVILSLKLMLYYSLNVRSAVQEFAFIYIHDLAHFLNISSNQIYINYKKDICKTIIDITVLNYVLEKWDFSRKSLHELVVAFKFNSTNDFIVQEGRYLLPFLIPEIVKRPRLNALLDSLSDISLQSSSELIINQFGNIYPYIYLNESGEMYKQCMQLIKNITNMDELALKHKHFRVIFNELFLYYHQDPSRVLEGLKNLCQEDMTVENKSQLIEMIQERFLGLLIFLDVKLNSKKVALSDKRHALQSIKEIIELIGTQYITKVRFKIIVTLRSTLNTEIDEFQKLSCDSWDAFVRNCDIDSIGSLLSTIFISLLPLRSKFPEVINRIFNYLVIEHEQDLLEFLPDLFFLIETNIGDNIKKIIQKTLAQHLKNSFRDQLQFYLKYIQHENVEVRIYALRFITCLLEKNREPLNELVLGTNGLDSIIIELIDLLLKGFREKNENLHLAVSTCIGELGAIDPSHMPKSCSQKNESFMFSINENNFAVLALNELIRAFQSEEDSRNMDCFALGIQEVLKAYNFSPTTNKKVWDNFPENQQQIMQPLLTSRYKIAFQTEKINVHPLFSKNNTNFTDWIHSWVGKLIFIVKTENFRNLFDCCQPSLKKDMQLLTFFLPYILLHAILEADSNENKEIWDEMSAVIQGYNSEGDNDENIQFKPLKSDLLRYMPSLPTNEELTLVQASKIIYILLDFLFRWLREWEKANCPKDSPQKDEGYCKVNNFVKQFSKLSIARSNYNCEEFPRALMYLEDYVNENPNELERQFSFFTRIYVQLEDPDGVAGIQVIQQQEPKLTDMILSHEISGQLQDATACYERLAQEVQLQPQTLQGLIRCYLDLDNPFTANRIMERVDNKLSDYLTHLHEYEIETFWRLNQYKKLNNFLQNPQIQKMSSWGVHLGNVLLYFHQERQELLKNELDRTRCALIHPLSVSSREEGSYEYGYPQIMKLHLLNELQKIQQLFNKIKNCCNVNECETLIENLLSDFEQREKLVQYSVRVLEPLFCLRRTALQQAQHLLTNKEELHKVFNKHIGNYWVKSAQVATVTGMHQQAYTYLLNAEHYKPPGLFVERAKLHWARGEQETAFSILKRGLEQHPLNNTNRKIISEAKLLVALYNEETANLDFDVNTAKYKEAVDSNKECEKTLVYVARFYDKNLNLMSGDKDIGIGGDLQFQIIYFFGKSLQYGKEFLYQSMPRMLSIWLDYGLRQYENNNKDTHETRATNCIKMTKLINLYLEKLPAYMFLSAFSQIVSRICHPQKSVYNELKSIIIKLIRSYPQQTLWMIMPVFKSSYVMRMRRCQEILQDERLRKVPALVTLIHDFTRLTEKLIELCNKTISNGISTTHVSMLVKSLPRLITSNDFSQIMLPVEKFLKMVLPISNDLLAEHNPYPYRLVYIVGIEDTVTIMPSLQKPRRITLLGSDGKRYMHMCKPKDDLRKDFRLMEFNGVVNQYLREDSEARQRRLHIRTYAVIPLNEECGIIEWVQNLIPFRTIISTLHKQKNSYVTYQELKKMVPNLRDSLVKKRQVYQEVLLVRHPLVFHEWFRQTFPNPYAWYYARTSYIRTTATISIVGYILGLGDRHGENILFDSTNGDTVHVDFNCLFNRGEFLEWPERVPFRLTANMVKAMGPLGVEGTFRRSCEVTLRTLRAQKDTLMSILKPFVYDPLVSWPKNPHAINADSNAERTNEQARDHVKNIESRLQGIKSGKQQLPIKLSVEGHVNSLILDATNVDNLCQMWVGWGAFL